jgi:hypothetical protein
LLLTGHWPLFVSPLVFGMGAAGELRKEQLPVVAELLPESDLRRVVAVDRHRLDRLEELDPDPVFAVGVPFFREAGEEGRLFRAAAAAGSRRSPHRGAGGGCRNLLPGSASESSVTPQTPISCSTWS